MTRPPRPLPVSQSLHRPSWVLSVLILVLALVQVSCSYNPATGQNQVMLISEAQELEMGRQGDADMVASMGLYDDPLIQEYVNALGQELASHSERPDLNWTFRVIDDPIVNAFALPGGYVYITRGILSHFNTEAELAAVLGHEIGHVIGRHSANQMSKQQLLQVGVIAGTILLDDDYALAGAIAGSIGAQLLSLKFGRDDEREADALGLRYLDRAGYDPRPMTEVFDTLGRVSEAAGAGGTPGWLSTHPKPEDRSERIGTAIASLNIDYSHRKVGREVYMNRVEGIVYGPDHRQGYFVDNAFYHPALALKLEFPRGWQVQNQRQAVVGVSGDQDALILLRMADEQGSLEEAERAFLAQQGVYAGPSWSPAMQGFQAVGREFEAQNNSGRLRGRVAFAEQDDNVLQLMALSDKRQWTTYEDAFFDSLTSFSRLRDRRYLEVDAARIDVVTLPRAMTLAEFHERFPSTIDLDEVAILNHAYPDTRFERGAQVKRVVGGELPQR